MTTLSSKSALAVCCCQPCLCEAKLSLKSRAHFADVIFDLPTVSCTFFQPVFKKSSKPAFFLFQAQINLSLQSCALFVDNFCRSRPETEETETLLRRPRKHHPQHRRPQNYHHHHQQQHDQTSSSNSPALFGVSCRDISTTPSVQVPDMHAFLGIRSQRHLLPLLQQIVTSGVVPVGNFDRPRHAPRPKCAGSIHFPPPSITFCGNPTSPEVPHEFKAYHTLAMN